MPTKPRKAGLSGRQPASNDQPAKDPANPLGGQGAAAAKPPKPTRARTRPGPKGIDWAPAYLAALSITGEKTDSARKAKVLPRAVYDRRMRDADFAESEKTAMKVAADSFESEAIRRAKRGIEERRYDPKTNKLLSTRRIYSDTILLRLLVKTETGSWRDSAKVEHAGAVDFTQMTRAQRLEKLAEAEKAARAPL